MGYYSLESPYPNYFQSWFIFKNKKNLFNFFYKQIELSEIVRLCFVCKRWNHEIVHNSLLWKSLSKEIDPSAKEISPSWKKCFRKYYTYLGYWDFLHNHEFINLSSKTEFSINNSGSITDKGLYVHDKTYYRIEPAKMFQAHLGMTIEVWFYPLGFRNEEYDNSIVSMHGNGYGWELRGNNKTATFLVTTTTGGHEEIHIDAVIQPNQWNHFAGIVSKSRKNIVFHANGKTETKILSDTNFVHGNSQPILCFGRNVEWDGRYLDGFIAKVRIVDRELSPIEFLPHPFQSEEKEELNLALYGYKKKLEVQRKK